MTRWDEEPEDKFTRNNRYSFPLHDEDGTIDYSVVRKDFLVDIDSESGRHFIIHCNKTDQQKIKMVFDAMDIDNQDSCCIALSLIKFLENEYQTDEDYIIGRKEFEPDIHSYYDVFDCNCKLQIQGYPHVNK